MLLSDDCVKQHRSRDNNMKSLGLFLADLTSPLRKALAIEKLVVVPLLISISTTYRELKPFEDDSLSRSHPTSVSYKAYVCTAPFALLMHGC